MDTADSRARHRLSPSAIISVIALAVALIGMPTAYAVGTGAIKSKMIAKGAVTAAKLAANAVTGAKIAKGAVTNDKIATGAITNDKLMPHAVTGDKIAPGAVAFGDLAPGTTIATIATSSPADGFFTIANSATVSIPLVDNSWVQFPGEVDQVFVEYEANSDMATTAYVGVRVKDAAGVYVGGGQGEHDYSTTWNRRAMPSFEYEAQSGSATPWVGSTDEARTLHVELVIREDGAASSAVYAHNVKVYVVRLR